MKDQYPKLLNSIIIKNKLKLKNRIFFASMGVDLSDINGCVTPEMIDFYQGIMEGGCSMAFLGNASITPQSKLQENGLALYNEAHGNSLKKIINMSKNVKTPLGVQLQHYGGQGTTKYTNTPVLTPSGIPCPRIKKLDPTYRTKIMDEEDIVTVVNQFANSAWLAWKGGADLVQLQASNGYLLSSFLSPYTNKRKDNYGGSEENRARLLCDTINAINKKTNNELIITVRLGIDDLLGQVGLEYNKLDETIQELCSLGVGAIECSMSIGSTFTKLMTYSNAIDEYLQKGVKKIKSLSTVPVGYAGFIDNLEKAEHILEKDICDWIGMSRALFADNNLINKTLHGDTENIHKCKWDSKCFSDKANPKFNRVYCCVNPKYIRPNS
ncbi:TPA: NADH:flavin oxidoreductase [Providencia alcalifaciens]